MSNSRTEFQPAPWSLFVLLLLANIVMPVLGNHWYLPSGVWKPVLQHTHGLVNQTLIWGLVYFLVVICGILLGVGRQRPEEVGLEPRKLPVGGLYTCVLWVMVQVALGGCYVALGKSPAIAFGWASLEVLEKVGGLLGQLLGNALCEEVLFRGFLLMQIVMLLSARWPHRPWTTFVVSLWLATAIFALTHLPYHLRPDIYASLSKIAWDQVQVFLSGCVLGWLYWRTRNLFFVVGVHALSNEPTMLFAWHNLGPLTRADPVVLFAGLVIAATWYTLPATVHGSSHRPSNA